MMRSSTTIARRFAWLGAVIAAGLSLTACGGDSNRSDQAPAVSVPASQTVTEGQTLSFTAVGSDPDSGTILHYELQGAPQGAAIDSLTGAFTWTPTYDEIGTHAVTCMVSDGLLSASAVVSVQVLPDTTVDNSVPLPGGTLDPLSIPKYVTPLVIPPVMNNNGTADNYSIAVRQFKQQILPGGLWNTLDGRADAFPATTVWGYGPDADPVPDSSALGGGAGIAPAGNSQFNYPGFTIETQADVPVKVRWINDLVDANDNYLPPLFIVDQTLHWANPPQDCADGRTATDCMGDDQEPYTGPVPIVTHLHGAHVEWTSDGYPEAWWLPAANNIPAGYATKGDLFGDSTGSNPGNLGFADYLYRNDQTATTLWYHDHALGMTRTNVYAGLAGFWLIRGDHTDAGGGPTVPDAVDDSSTAGAPNDGVLPGPAPRAGDATLAVNTPGDPVRNAIREIPIAIQDRSFNADGSFFYPATRSFFEGLESPSDLLINFDPDSDIAPLWNPEAFFNVMVVNGVSWPKLEVAQAKYRFRLLNGCNSRFLNLALLVVDPATGRTDASQELPFYVMGYEQGPLPKVVKVSTGYATTLPGDGTVPADAPALDPDQALLMAPAERPDVIVDFSGLPDGTVVRMINTAPDDPFGGFNGLPGEDAVADPLTTGQVMEFIVNSALTGASPTDPGGATPATAMENLVLNPEPALGAPTRTRQVSLNEEESNQVCVVTGFGGTAILQLDGITPADPSIPMDDLRFVADCEAAGGVPFAPKAALLGTVDLADPSNPAGVPLRWTDNSGTSTPADVQLADGSVVQIKVTENPSVGDTEEWQIYNFTEDAHPIHLHLVRFEVMGRTLMDGTTPSPQGSVQPWETSYKDMVIAYPGEITTVKAKFDIPGLYVWHCHILEHEDNEMMRPYVVSPAP